VHAGSDYAAISSVGLGVTLLGGITALVGALLLVSGRGGPEDWRRQP
jgi:hypothetical protein